MLLVGVTHHGIPAPYRDALRRVCHGSAPPPRCGWRGAAWCVEGIPPTRRHHAQKRGWRCARCGQDAARRARRSWRGLARRLRHGASMRRTALPATVPVFAHSAAGLAPLPDGRACRRATPRHGVALLATRSIRWFPCKTNIRAARLPPASHATVSLARCGTRATSSRQHGDNVLRHFARTTGMPCIAVQRDAGLISLTFMHAALLCYARPRRFWRAFISFDRFAATLTAPVAAISALGSCHV